MYEDDELNAQFQIDGIAITSGSNTVDDVLDGVTLNLMSTQETSANAIDITVGTDNETVQSNLETFFEKYNDVLNYIKTKSAVDPDTGTRGDLAGDFTFTNIRTNLRLIVSSAISSVQENNPELLSRVGIEPDDDGNLSITDEDTLDDVLDVNVDKVADLFNSENGIAAQISDLLKPFTNTGGIIDDNTKVLERRVSSINTRISNWEQRLSYLEQNYRDQFTKLQQAFVAITNQQSLIQMITSTVGSFGY
jgi:flagellar hook-associated protein 2